MSARFLTLRDDELWVVMLEFNVGMAFLHLELRRKVKGFREAKRLFPQLRAWLRRMGHESVFVIIPEGDRKLYRFERHFGFFEIDRSGGKILMGQDC